MSTFWDTSFEALTNPLRFWLATFGYLTAWAYTRKWHWVAIGSLPIVLIVVMIGLAITGWWTNEGTIQNRMKRIALSRGMVASTSDDEHSTASKIEGDQTGSDEVGQAAVVLESSSSESESSSDPFVELVMRRMLQLRYYGPSEDAIEPSYYVASKIATRGRLGQALKMMREIAPVNASGFGYAHAWLAAHAQTIQRPLTPIEAVQLLHDLEEEAKFNLVYPNLRERASILEQLGRVDEAVALLRSAPEEMTQASIQMAAIAARHNLTETLRESSNSAKNQIKKLVYEQNATVEDWKNLATVLLLEKGFDNALVAVQEGQKLDPANPQLAHLKSEVYRQKFIEGTKQDPPVADLKLLEQAFQADPSNMLVLDLAANQLVAGNQLPPSLQAAIDLNINAGTASYRTHFEVASTFLISGKVAEAVPLLETALSQAPENTSILNNLALALALSDRNQIPRAMSLCQQALTLSPGKAEYWDTYGDLQTLGGDNLGAIQSFETVLTLDGSRSEARQKLVQAYEKEGMQELANMQRAYLKNAVDLRTQENPNQ
ncbi:MAG: hypothetical protein KDB03_06655 [Planctomycetales bacterium]|nr:hypothetical protein [Planctomycetales bacterium]